MSVKLINTLKHINHRCSSISFNASRSTNTATDNVIRKHRRSALNKDRVEEEPVQETAPPHFRYAFPDFLPDPTPYYRDPIREKLERKDMLKRRSAIDIPEFYVGTIMAVTIADIGAPDKKTRFVGLCTERGGHGTRSWFTIRNHVAGQGVEISYMLYHPKVQKIEVLKLEKRLDTSLAYLKDAPPEYSTIPFDFQKILLPPGAPVPVNTVMVKMNTYPWFTRWELLGFKGMDMSESRVWPKRLEKMQYPQNARPWEKHDLMKQYRESIDDETAEDIMAEVKQGLDKHGRKKSSVPL